MSIKSKMMAAFDRFMGRKTTKNEIAKAELAIAASQGRAKGDAVRLRSCRERGFGSENVRGVWQSPFTRYLRAIVQVHNLKLAEKRRNRVKVGYGPEAKQADVHPANFQKDSDLDADLKLGQERLADVKEAQHANGNA